MKKIALDLDGVVFDTETLYRVYTEVYDVENYKSDNNINNSKRLFTERYSWSDDVHRNFYDKYALEVIENAPVMTGCEKVLKKLVSDFEFIVITARKDNEIEFAKRFFDKQHLNIKIYNNCSKIDKCLELGISYIIDDDDITCLDASNKGIKALYFKNNASVPLNESDNLKNVHNWGEIYKYLMLGENK